jgi:AhpD family alkylhydroperoxidase
MPTTETSKTKERTLVALGASVAAGCQPCTEHFVRAAREAGACERSIALAVDAAVAVRENATRRMDQWAGRCQGSRPELDPEFRVKKGLAAELASVAAAVCVNSVADLTIHLAAARGLGATAEQVRAAIAIARAVKRTAEEKLEAALALEAEAGASVCCGSAAEPCPTTDGGGQPCECR